MTTRVNTIPRCWTREPDPAPGTHRWGQICYGDGDAGGCADWWLARSIADRRTHRQCDNWLPHGGPHVYFDAGDWQRLPPQPFTMWVCPGLDPLEG